MPEQSYLLPPSPMEWLPDGHLAYFVLEVVRELDLDAIANGTISLIHARGILSDGLVFNMPESDELPPPRNIADVAVAGS